MPDQAHHGHEELTGLEKETPAKSTTIWRRLDPSLWLPESVIERLWQGYVSLWLGLILIPPVILVLVSFDSAEYLRLPQELSMIKYQLMVESDSMIQSIKQTLLLAIITTLIAPVLALLAALAYRRTKYKSILVAVIALPLFTPGIVQGFGLLIFFKQLGIANGTVPMAIGHIIWAFPFAFLVLLIMFSTISDDLPLASRDLGANEYQTFRYVIFPLIKPGMISAFTFSFILSINEFARSSLLAGSRNTVPTLLWAKLNIEFAPQIFALAGLTVIISLIPIMVGLGSLYLGVGDRTDN